MSDLRTRAGRLLAPIGRRCPVSPDVLTLLALAFALGAAALLAAGRRWPEAFGLAIVAAAAGGALDLLDGVVAREQGLASRWGDFLDHFSDRVSDAAMTAGWVIGAGVRPAIGLFAIAAVMLNGYAGTQVEASFRTREYATTGRGEFFIAILGLPLLAWLGGDAARDTAVLRLPLFDLLTLMVAIFALAGVGQRVAHARRLARRDGAPPVQ
ncbi:MAG: CDP-alcohol phosphatidyltransferase family protein [Thermoanaerobaculia bacterium]